MTGIILLVLLFLTVTVACWAFGAMVDEAILGGIIGAIVGAFLVAFLWVPVIAATGGLWSDYSTGDRIGYVTKASVKGLIWKTNEIQIQVGTGEMAALQEPQPLSVPDADLFAEISAHVGSRAKLTYTQWIVQPYWRGESGYEVVKVEWQEKEATR